MNKETFKKLKDFSKENLELTPENVMEKSLKFNNLYIHYHNLYVKEKKLLKDINNNMKKVYSDLYHYYKFGAFDFKLDNKHEIETYIFGNDKYYDLKVKYDEQVIYVDYLLSTMEQIQKTSFQIGHYIDLLKIKNGLV